MNTNNKIHTFGDNNIELQNITARDINIITGQESNTEIKENKEKIAQQIAELLAQLGSLPKPEITENNDLNDSDFDNIDWDDLLEAIEIGNCVLFIGQEIATDEKGNSLHEDFFKQISRRNVEYDEKDGFFMPGAEKKIETKALTFYDKKFQEKNNNAYQTLLKLAQIPFSLILPICPDDTMHQIFEKYNKKHCFRFFKPNEKQETEEPDLENPIIYNLLGNAADDGKYIYTHEQYYKYVNENQDVKIPLEIENKIKDVPNYIFIGIDFNRWYNRLLLFVFNLYKSSEAYAFSKNKINEFTQNFIDKQFNILNIDSKYDDFIDILLQKAKEKGISINLTDTFIENTKDDIISIKDKARKSDSLAELREIEGKINKISEKIIKLK